MKQYLKKAAAVLFALLLVLPVLAEPKWIAAAQTAGDPPLLISPQAEAPARPKAELSGNTASLRWESLSGAAGYRVYLRTYGGSYRRYAVTDSPALTIPKLSYGKTYYVRVRAELAGGGFSDYYPTVRFTTGPKAPAVKLSQKKDLLQVSWNDTAASAYGVYLRKAGGKYSRAALQPENSIRLSGLKPGTYYVKVRGFTRFGGRYYPGSYSATQKITLKASAPSLDPASVTAKLYSMADRYPEGMHWTNDNVYVTTAYPQYTTMTGYGCAGFAFLMSDSVFGKLPVTSQHHDFDRIRPGDVLKFTSPQEHWVIVLEVLPDSVIVAEGNYNSSIHWGREFSRAELRSRNFRVDTRYPKNS